MLFVAATVFSASARDNFVEGQILNNDAPARGVVVKISTNQKTTTDRHGNFSIRNVQPDRDTLFVELDQNRVLEIALEGDNYFNINLHNDSILIERDRFQVLNPSHGGTMISRRELLQSGDTNLQRAISNRVPGARFTNGTLLLRGGRPLFVINNMRTFNPPHIPIWDVESVEVVQGPQTAFFGQDGASGVVIIRMRSGVN